LIAVSSAEYLVLLSYVTGLIILQEALENSRQEITTVMMKSYPQLLQKYVADKAKVSSLVEIILLLKLDLFSLKRQEQVGYLTFRMCMFLNIV